ncbi:DUF2784 domain-containing protein [Mycobacterium szulgai]|uniref:DUF2784 domain-containing protein n=1 Tax=Mycobacterium szulgai TaxID=1787 RepID=UPI000A1EAD04|nr:DUF2784 domain-containing protein [Mycobacterium szulgai]MCV7076013.1 DUF2784 domain-containing protein [Mycobacterium szulgai]
MRKIYFAVVAASIGAHFGYLIYLPSGGFLALRWPRTFWLHLPSVCWGIGVVALHWPCPLTSLEDWARARAGVGPLPKSGFIGRYVEGVCCPANRIGTAQTLAFAAAAVSWILLARRRWGGVATNTRPAALGLLPARR